MYTSTMRTFEFQKLVRDKIVTSMEANGDRPKYRRLTDKEYLQALHDKILEEARELNLDSTDEAVKELADVQEVIDCLTTALGITSEDIKAAQAKKNAKAGSFQERIYVDTIELDDDAEWVEYFATHPDQYPEVTS